MDDFDRFSIVTVAQCFLLGQDVLESRHVGSEHLLLGIVGEGQSPAAKFLTRMGATLEAVRAEVQRLADA